MIQRFIQLGEGYSDIYELFEIARNNKHRLAHLFAFHTKKNNKEVTSLAVALQPTTIGDFQPIYICLEGIPNPHFTPSKRYDLFEKLATELNKSVIQMDVKPSDFFNEKDMYFQNIISVLRLNHYIPPMQ
jgi:hypothetical protein